MKVIGIITARGGSKSIHKKNIADLAGKPILAYSVDTALKSGLTDVILSTDDEEIAEVGRIYGVKVPFMRPAELAGDDVKHVPVLIHALQEYEKITGQTYDYILTIQPTSPFRAVEDIDMAIEIARKNQPDCVVSLEKFTDLSLEKVKYLNEGGLVESAFQDEKNLEGLPRQSRRALYRRNGAIYLTKREILLNGSVYGEKILGFEMPPERSVDINGPIDLKFAEFLLSSAKWGKR